MSAVPCRYEDGLSQGFTRDFNQMINGISSRIADIEIADDVFKTQVTLEEARGLELCLMLMEKQHFPDDLLNLIQGILNAIEKFLSEIHDEEILKSDFYEELRSAYLRMSQLVCIILIRKEDEKQNRETRNAG